MLPQYHPQQLIEMLYAGKTKRVKAILRHVLRILKSRRNLTVSHDLSARKISSFGCSDYSALMGDDTTNEFERRNSVMSAIVDDDNLNYEELDLIAPIPLYALYEADNLTEGVDESSSAINSSSKENYEFLFNQQQNELDSIDLINDNGSMSSGLVQRRHSSASEFSKVAKKNQINIVFTTRHSKILTELLTHAHLPGLFKSKAIFYNIRFFRPH